LLRRGGKLAAQAGRALFSMAAGKVRDALPGTAASK
jgi:hypothetical protein